MSTNNDDESSSNAPLGYESLTPSSQRVLRTVGSPRRRTRDKLARNFHIIKDKIYESRIPRFIKTPHHLLQVEETPSTVVLPGHDDLVHGDSDLSTVSQESGKSSEMSWGDNPRSDGGGYDNDMFENGGFRRGTSDRMDIPLGAMQKRTPEPKRKHSQDVGTGGSNGHSHRNSHKKKRKESHSEDDYYNNELNNTYVLPKGADVNVPIYKPQRGGRPSSASSTQTFVVQANDDKQKLLKNGPKGTPGSIARVKFKTERKMMSQEYESGKTRRGRILDPREIEKKARKSVMNEVSNSNLSLIIHVPYSLQM